jgi:thermitase
MSHQKRRVTISNRARKAAAFAFVLTVILVTPGLFAAVPESLQQSAPPTTLPTSAASRIVVRFADHSVVNVVQPTGLLSTRKIDGLPGVHVLEFNTARNAEQAMAGLESQPGVVWAEPDRLMDFSFSPGDPLTQDQLWIESIDLRGAWTLTTGDPSVIVAVVDSGVSTTHPDLVGKVLPGYDFLNDHANPVDEVGHGTAVAGIIAARGGDGVGIAGVAMDASILPVKVGSVDGSPISAIAAGIVWAVDQGADVVNLSLGADFNSNALESAVQYAYDRNVPVVTAAGNEPEAISYPGAYPQSISVGASTHWGTLTGFTSRANRVDLIAPGSNVLTTWAGKTDGDTWAAVTGTSFAAPMVSGTLALLLSLDPGLTIEELRFFVQSTAIPVGEIDPEPGGGAGQLDAGAALASFLAQAFDQTWSPADNPVASGSADRTWVWGPDPIATGFEAYGESASGERLIRYYDKARMEINDPAAFGSDPWFVTNGLLARELISGKMQIGDQTFQTRAPARIVVAGDWGDSSSPTYSAFANLLGAAPASPGSVLTSRVSANGQVQDDQQFAQYNVYAAWYVPETNHQIASVFWTYLNSLGLIDMGGELVIGPLFEPTFYATGLPITEAYWTEARVNGVLSDVLVQCFERRCLTYTPSNPVNWQVEMGNVGQHYFNWRYNNNAAIPRPSSRLWNLGWRP